MKLAVNMSKNKIFWISTLIIILTAILNIAYTQDISFTASAPKVLRAEEQFQLTYTVNKDIDNFTPPNFGEFRYVGGPHTGQSTSFQMINGKTTRSSTYTYTYYLQAPPNAGTYTIAHATATYKRDEYKSNSLNIEVVGSGTQSSQGSKQDKTVAGSTISDGEDIFVQLVADKKTAYIGEQITAWVKLYTKVQISGIDQQFKGPNFVGFYQQNVEIPQTSFEREKVGNDIYYSGVLSKVILYPQKSGEIKIEPFNLLVEVQEQSSRTPRSIFDEFFGSPVQRKRINLKSKPLTFNIRQLPGNQPEGFSGAVGHFEIGASVSETNVKTNDAIIFRVAISGRGNIKLIESIGSDFPPAFEVFDPVKEVRLDKNNDNRTGKVLIEYTAIPRHAGHFTVPPFSLVYFDPLSRTYKTITTRSFDIIVEKGEGDSTSVQISNLSKEEVELLGSDIRYIETITKLKRKDRFYFGSKWFFSLYILSFAAFIVVLIIRREQIKRSANVVKYKNRKANKVASRKLKMAQRLLKQDKKEEFYDELSKALWGFLSDKLNISISELSKGHSLEVLQTQKVNIEISDEFFAILEICEYARFAPGNPEAEMSGLYKRAEKVITKLDQKIKI
ncbi:MAG: protein BatD [Bacteroidales bacterium]|nr:protein BatD [Bacteroidales bacterium]